MLEHPQRLRSKLGQVHVIVERTEAPAGWQNDQLRGDRVEERPRMTRGSGGEHASVRSTRAHDEWKQRVDEGAATAGTK